MVQPLVLVLVCAAALLAATALALAAEPLATVTVEAGKHDRLDTPVWAPLDVGLATWSAEDGAFRQGGPWWPALTERRDGRDVPVPCQVAPGTPPRLWWILGGKTAAGESRSFRVSRSGERPRRAADVRRSDETLDVTVGGKPVLRYRMAPVEPPAGVDRQYARNAYIAPAWTPSGLVVTDDFPPDHLHQRGIWFSWTKTEFDGRHPDFWNMKDAAIRFARMGPVAGGPVFASFEPHHEHLDLKAPGGQMVILEERWDVRVWNTGGPEAGYWLWDLVSTQRCAADRPLRLPKYHYGGLGYRGHREWLKQVSMRTSEGKTRADGNETKARWLDLSGPLDGKRAGVLILIHPTNFRYPQPLRLNSEQPQICVAPSQEGDWAIEPGAEYVSRYRFVVHDGDVTDATAARLWADFAEPPAVKVK